MVPESYADFIDLVIPELQSRGAYKTAYAPGTLREKIFGEGPRLPARHTASTFRPTTTGATPAPLTARA
ncbi:FMN-dependent oxidoreductase, nitrilotriacetate monooxygenase family [compost metagenome]